MVSRKKTATLFRTGENASKCSLFFPAQRSKTAASAKRRQTSLFNFFAGKTKRVVTSQENSNKMITSKSFPLTPPTPVSPQTPLTPPTARDAPIATPPSPDNVPAVFKKAKLSSTDQTQKAGAKEKRPTVQKNRQQKKTLEQTYLDLGQGDFGKRTICKTCGMLYVHGLSEDSQQHSRICMDYMKGIPFTVSQARVVATDSRGFIVEVRHSDSYTLRSKVKRVKEIVDRDLGFVPSETTSPQTRTAYLYIADKRVIGMATAELIPHAFVSYTSLERSSERQKAMAGIHQLWVHAKFRGQGIATRLMDAVREKLVFGLTVPKNLLAFSSPTEAGARFARSYVCGDSTNATTEILVYDCF